MTKQEELIAAGLNRKKPTKQDAQDLVLQLAERTDDNRTLDALTQLYEYFTPPIPKVKKGLTDFQWCALAVDPKDIRPSIRFIRVTTTYITGTDGHRCHRAVNLDLMAPGWYLPTGERLADETVEAEGYSWPPSDKLFPAKLPDHETRFVDIKTPLEDVVPIARGTKLAIRLTEHYGIRYDWLIDAATERDTSELNVMEDAPDFRVFVNRGTEREAVIMGVKL